MKKNSILLTIIALFYVVEIFSQTKIAGFGLTRKLNDNMEFVPTLSFDLNRTDPSKEKNKDLAFWTSETKSTQKGKAFNFGFFPVADVNIGEGVKSSINNISAGLLFDFYVDAKLEGQSAHFFYMSTDYTADRNFESRIFSITPGYKFYLAKGTKYDLSIGIQYSLGERAIDSLENTAYQAPEVKFGLAYDISERFQLKNSTNFLYLLKDNEVITEIDKGYFYNKSSIEYRLQDENVQYSTIGLSHEYGFRPPLFSELNTITLSFSFYIDN